MVPYEDVLRDVRASSAPGSDPLIYSSSPNTLQINWAATSGCALPRWLSTDTMRGTDSRAQTHAPLSRRAHSQSIFSNVSRDVMLCPCLRTDMPSSPSHTSTST